MRVEVDQSGRFENTSQDTVVAFSNGECFSILIPARVKRACIERMRRRGIKPPRTQVLLFATALYLLLKEHIHHIDLVEIDQEYVGHEHLINQHVRNLFARAGVRVYQDKFRFVLVGKKSPAHKVAIETFRGRRQPDKVIFLEEMLVEL